MTSTESTSTESTSTESTSTESTSTEDTALDQELRDLLGAQPPAAAMPAGRAEARREHLESVVGANVTAHHRRRLAVVGASVGVAVLVAAGSAAAYVSRAPATDTTYARCYSSASLSDKAVGTVSEATAAGEPDVADSADHALEMCALWWNFTLTGETSYDGAADGDNTPPVPDLVACVLKNGAVGVFPGDDQTCFELGLPKLATG